MIVLTVAESIPDSLPLVSASLNNLLILLAITADGESRSNVLAGTQERKKLVS